MLRGTSSLAPIHCIYEYISYMWYVKYIYIYEYISYMWYDWYVIYIYILLQSLFGQQHVLFQGNTTLPRISVEKPETSGAGTFLGGVHCEATGRNGAATGGHLHRSSPHLKWGKNGEKIGKKWEKLWKKPWYVHHENLYTDSTNCDEKDWNHGMEWGSKFLNMFEPTTCWVFLMVTMIWRRERAACWHPLATAPPALWLAIPASHHCAPFAFFLFLCWNYARCLVKLAVVSWNIHNLRPGIGDES